MKTTLCNCGQHAFRKFEKHTITALVSACDRALLERYWQAEKYARSNGVRIKNKNAYLHKAVLPGSGVIDHINGNPADNRKENLRRTTYRVNSINSKDRSDWKHPTGCRGVYKQFRRGVCYYAARVYRNGKAIHLGYFKNFDDAVSARKEAELTEYNMKAGR